MRQMKQPDRPIRDFRAENAVDRQFQTTKSLWTGGF